MNKKVSFLVLSILLFNAFLGTANAAVVSSTSKTTISTGVATSTSVTSLKKDLGFGSTGDDVKLLQTWLAQDKSIYPLGLVSGYFGQATLAAVKKYQIINKIVSTGNEVTTGFGRVGPKTRLNLNADFSNKSITTATPIATTTATIVASTTPVVPKPSTVTNLDAKGNGLFSAITNYFGSVFNNVAYSGSQQAPNYPAPPHGQEVVYSVSSGSGSPINFTSVDINPLVVYPGDKQTIKVTLNSQAVSVTAVTTLDSKILTLNLVDDGTGSNTWIASWIVNDTSVTVYRTTFTATDSAGNTGTTNMAWSDPCTGFASGQDSTLGANCTMSVADGVDGGNLTIPTGTSITLNPGAALVFNPGKSITKHGVISLAKGATIQKAYLFYPDPLNTGYTTSEVTKIVSTSPTLTNYVRASTVLGIYCDGNTATPPGATRTRYQTSAVACGTSCLSETQTCSAAGTWSGSYSGTSCTASTRTGYTTSSVSCGSACTTQGQTCQTNGAWDGTSIGSCTANPAQTWYLDADNDGYYPSSNPPITQCSSPGAGWTTTVKTQGDCNDSDVTVYAGTTRTRYNSSSVSCGTACASETQTCQTNSTWSGSYSGTSCSASTRSGYTVGSSACGTYSCNVQTQTCQTNGSFDGSGVTSCTVATRSGYTTSSSGCGIYACNTQTQTCQSSGSFDGSGVTSCTVASRTGYNPASSGCGIYACNTETQYCQSGGGYGGTGIGSCTAASRTGYTSSSVSCGLSCTTQTQYCQSGGGYGGTGIGSCTPVAPGYTYGAYCNQNSCGTYGGTITNACTGSCSGGIPSTPYTAGASCNPNSCGTYGGTITDVCSGSCSGGVPGTPYTYGAACNVNSCGTAGGTITNACTGSCSGGTPAVPYTYGANCNVNACGTVGGTINNACTGSCSGSTPATPYTVGGACNRTTCSTTGTYTNACTGSCSQPATSSQCEYQLTGVGSYTTGGCITTCSLDSGYSFTYNPAPPSCTADGGGCQEFLCSSDSNCCSGVCNSGSCVALGSCQMQ